MKVYRYGLQHRPLQNGAQPRGYIPDPVHARTHDRQAAEPEVRFGWLDYPAPLSEADVKAYELNPLGSFDRFDAETEYAVERRTAEPWLNFASIVAGFADGSSVTAQELAKLPPTKAVTVLKVADRFGLSSAHFNAGRLLELARTITGGATQEEWEAAVNALEAEESK